MFKKMLAVVALYSLTVGCGGGGGGTPGTGLPAAYTGNTAQATVTTSNARAVSVSAYSGIEEATSLDVLLKAVDGQGGGQTPLLQEVVSALKDSVATIAAEQKTSAKVAAATETVQDTVSGYSGYFSFTGQADSTSGAISGTLIFSQYKAFSTSAVMNGTFTFSANFDQATDTFANLSFTMTGITVNGDGVNISMSGSMAISSSGLTETTIINFAITDNVTSRTTVLKDYTLQLYNESSLTISGTYYDPTHGFVVISTVTALTVSDISDTPTAGVLLFTGTNGTKARMTFTSTGYTVEADTAGNGTFVVVP